MARQAFTRDSACGPPPAARAPCPPQRPVPGVPATLALGARPAGEPPRLGPKGAGLIAARPRPAWPWVPRERPPRPGPDSRAAGRPRRPPQRGGPEARAEVAVRPGPAPDAAGRRPRCGRHRASQLRPLRRSRPRQPLGLHPGGYTLSPHLRRLSGPQRWRLGRRPGKTTRKAAAVYFQGPCLRHTRVCTRPHTRRCARLSSASPTRPISAAGRAGQSESPAGSAAAREGGGGRGGLLLHAYPLPWDPARGFPACNCSPAPMAGSLLAFPQPRLTTPASRCQSDCPGLWSRLAGASLP